MDDAYQVNQHWKRLASQIVKPQQIVLVIGATDVGKSTFCRFLIDFALTHGLKTVLVDADVGQSQIGPPTTIGMKSFAPETPSVQFNGTADQLYFVGNLSPRGHHLEVLTGTRLMVDSAREIDADFIVIDTTGYLHDTSAVSLKRHKIELIRPNHTVCIGRSSELEQIIAYYSQQDWFNIHRLIPDRNVRSKSSKARSRYRKAQFDIYFSESTLQRLPFEQIRGGRTPFFIGRIANEKELEILSRLSETQVYYAEWGHRTLCLIASTPLSKAVIIRIKNYLSLVRVTSEVRAYFERRLIGLIGTGSSNTYAIGIIENIDFKKREFGIRCKADAVKQACAIQFGNCQIN